jgi:hypothetical protein
MFFLRVFHITIHFKVMGIVPEVLKVVGIFMKDAADNPLHGGAVVMKHIHGIALRAIHTIGGGELIPKLTDRILKGPFLRHLSPHVLLHPFNGEVNNLTTLFDR